MGFLLGGEEMFWEFSEQIVCEVHLMVVWGHAPSKFLKTGCTETGYSGFWYIASWPELSYIYILGRFLEKSLYSAHLHVVGQCALCVFKMLWYHILSHIHVRHLMFLISGGDIPVLSLPLWNTDNHAVNLVASLTPFKMFHRGADIPRLPPIQGKHCFQVEMCLSNLI